MFGRRLSPCLLCCALCSAAAAQDKASAASGQKAADKGPAANKKEIPRDEEFIGRVKKAKEASIAWLRKARTNDGNWEGGPLTILQPGGQTTLAVLALLEAGISAEDPDLAPAIEFVRKINPEFTYTVSLQTLVFCKLDQKQDAESVRRNVAWLEKAAIRGLTGRLKGWSYSINSKTPDNSNTEYAVFSLHRAGKAGFKPTSDKLWKEIRECYLAGQQINGGWAYRAEGQFPATQTMTAAGLCGLLLCDEVLKPDKDSERAENRGFDWLQKNFTLTTGVHRFYQLSILARLGRFVGKRTSAGPTKEIDWYAEGAEWLLKQQKDDGGFAATKGAFAEALPVVNTSFALIFLSAKD
jgi:hypothetical protein